MQKEDNSLIVLSPNLTLEAKVFNLDPSQFLHSKGDLNLLSKTLICIL